MRNDDPTPVSIAVRVYPEPPRSKGKKSSDKGWTCPNAMFVFDTETRTDTTQRLTFGSYRFLVDGRCLEEGLFYGDDLPDKDREILERYAAAHSPETVREGHWRLRVLTRAQFVDRLFRAVYKSRCLLVGFNLPFDLSRVACGFTSACGDFSGGFSLELWSYVDKSDRDRADHYRPAVCVKHIDSKRAVSKPSIS